MGLALILLLLLLLVSTLIVLTVVIFKRRNDARIAQEAAATARREEDKLQAQLSKMRIEVELLLKDNASLKQFSDVRDAAAEAASIRTDAEEVRRLIERQCEEMRLAAQRDASKIRTDASTQAESMLLDTRASNAEARKKSASIIDEANTRASRIVADADARAKQIAGDAYRALQEAEQIEKAAAAMRNIIEGYSDRYLIPTYSLLDQLADDYGFEEAGRELKASRSATKSFAESGRAASCDYVENNRRETAIRFVLDAFNGKVDTILARVKNDNAGTLEQQIRDAYALVNHNGQAFRSAKITPAYLNSRLEELKWAAAAQALRERDKDEQRRIREQIREEEKARREIDRALKEAAKEEESIQKAVAKVQAQAAKASDEQRLVFEMQLQLLQGKLVEAEARNQRALSMAQQTRAGHVYIISNIGSFGENVLKVGMTRRLEPIDRIRELGDASVPFSFDVHAMIWSEDAPALERELHKRFVTRQINKVNPRKEFFRIAATEIRDYIESIGCQAIWTLTAEAVQYRETIAIEKALVENTQTAHEWLRMQSQYEPETLSDEEIGEARI